MDLLSATHFLQGSIATSDLVKSHQLIYFNGNTLSASNGVTKAFVHHEHAKELDNTAVMGSTFVKAVQAAGDKANLSTTKGGKLCVSSGKIKTFMSLAESEPVKKENQVAVVQDSLPSLHTDLKKLLPFVSTDGQAAWAGGVFFDGADLFATDSRTLIQLRTEKHFDARFVLPFQGIKELLRIKNTLRDFCIVQMGGSEVVKFKCRFDDAELIIYPIDSSWPNIRPMLSEVDYSGCQKVDSEFFETLASLKPFTDEHGSVYLKKGKWRTSLHNNTGSVVDCTVDYKKPKTKKDYEGCYDINQILSLKDVATKIDFGKWPEKVPFVGKKLRGVMVGRLQ